MNIHDGDIFLTRWEDESMNNFPGYWNHAAIYREGNIIESLMNIGVVTTPFKEWKSKEEDGFNFITLRLKDSEKLKYPNAPQIAADYAVKLIGGKYRMIASLFSNLPWWRIEKGLNCVAVVRIAYKEDFKKDPMWRITDNIAEDNRFVHLL